MRRSATATYPNLPAAPQLPPACHLSRLALDGEDIDAGSHREPCSCVCVADCAEALAAEEADHDATGDGAVHVRERVWDAEPGTSGAAPSAAARKNPLLALLWASWQEGARLVHAKRLYADGGQFGAAARAAAREQERRGGHQHSGPAEGAHGSSAKKRKRSKRANVDDDGTPPPPPCPSALQVVGSLAVAFQVRVNPTS
jgi:hypothetical protein